MKYKIYLRIGRGNRGYKVSASSHPINDPIKTQSYPQNKFIPTVSFAVIFDIPDELFRRAEKVVAELNIKEDEANISGEIQKKG